MPVALPGGARRRKMPMRVARLAVRPLDSGFLVYVLRLQESGLHIQASSSQASCQRVTRARPVRSTRPWSVRTISAPGIAFSQDEKIESWKLGFHSAVE